MNNSNIRLTILIISLLLSNLTVKAQNIDTLKIEFNDVWNFALNNNIDLQNSLLNIKIAEKTRNQSFALPKTEFIIGRGYVNTPDLVDNSYSINQNFGPIFKYFANSSLYKNEYEKAEFENIMVEKTVKFAVAMAYNTWLFAVLRKEILTEQTSYLEDLANYSTKRFDVGDIHSMENNINQMNFLKAQNELIAVQNNYLEADLALRKLILFDEKVTLWPIKDIQTIKYTTIKKDIILDSLFLKIIDKTVEIQNTKISVAKSDYYPEISASYTNQQLEHINGNQSFTVGLAVPLWFVTNKAEVQKARINLEKEKLNAYNRKFDLKNQLINSTKRYHNYSDQLDKLGENTYHKVKEFREQLYATYTAGEISGYQFAQSLDIYFNILSNYLDLVENYNSEIITLKYFTE